LGVARLADVFHTQLFVAHHDSDAENSMNGAYWSRGGFATIWKVSWPPVIRHRTHSE
jgi:hypothetical protein